MTAENTPWGNHITECPPQFMRAMGNNVNTLTMEEADVEGTLSAFHNLDAGVIGIQETNADSTQCNVRELMGQKAKG